ncbi:MAG: hypothetical protein WCP71_04220 [Actinomycetes bacterium]
MSTKTVLKRVALVAAAALAIGGISAVSANAAVNTNLNIAVGYTGVGTNAGIAIAGPANSIGLTVGTIAPFAGPIAAHEYVTVTGGTFVGGTTAQTLATLGTISVATPTVGTITVSGYLESAPGIFPTTATETVTISVVAFTAGTIYGSSTVWGASGVTVPTSVTDGAFSVTASALPASTQVANFLITEADVNAVALTTGWKAITATVTNGLLSTPGGNPAGTGSITPTTYIAATQTAAGPVDIALSNITGLSGTSTVTISVNGVVAKTYTVTFTGAAVKIVATVLSPVIGIGTPVALLPVVSGNYSITANTGALKVQEFDANGNALTVPALTLASSDTAKVAVAIPALLVAGSFSTTAVGVSLQGVAAGTSSLTVTDGTLTSNAVSVRVSSGVPTAVVVTSDAAAYPAGGAGTLSYTASDAAGTLPAGTYSAVYTTGPSASFALTVGVLPTTSLTVNESGVQTVAFNAPLSDGTTTIAGTAATGITETAASFTVSSGASDAANAATDAANEATDAANAATDAANAAADSADAATQAAQDAGDKADAALAAVTALGQQVTSVLAKVAALSALLVRIIKKVKA